MLQTTKHLLSLIRFSHTIFALPFALLAALMAWYARAIDGATPALGGDPVLHQHFYWFELWRGGPILQADGPTVTFLKEPARLDIRWQELLGILLCMVFARSAAMAFNRLVDRRIDAGNPRTAGRHLPAGILSVAQVTTFAVLCSAGFVASTLLFLPNWLPFYLSVPVLLFLCGYSYTKRFTSLAHFWLGAALAMSPMAAWIAIRGEAVLQNPLDLLPAATLGAGVLTWVAGFDILYACQDYDFDRGAQLNSIPTRLGVPGALRLAAGCHAATVLLLALLPAVYPPFGWLYGIGIAAVAVLLVYEHRLVSPDNLEKVNLAFFNVNAVISLGLLVVGALDLLV